MHNQGGSTQSFDWLEFAADKVGGRSFNVVPMVTVHIWFPARVLQETEIRTMMQRCLRLPSFGAPRTGERLFQPRLKRGDEQIKNEMTALIICRA